MTKRKRGQHKTSHPYRRDPAVLNDALRQPLPASTVRVPRDTGSWWLSQSRESFTAEAWARRNEMARGKGWTYVDGLNGLVEGR